MSSIATSRKFPFLALVLCDCSSSPYLISTQQDATELYQCADKDGWINGNVTIATSVTGNLSFPSFGSLDGCIVAENNPMLTSLHFEADDEIRQIVLRNLTNFSVLSAPNLAGFSPTTDLGLHLEDLPSLETIAMPSLYIMGNLTLHNIPKVTSFSPYETEDTGRLAVFGNVYIENVGIASLDYIIQSGFHPKNYSADGIPNVQSIKFTHFRSSNFAINGNGNLSMVFDCSTCNTMTNTLREVSADTVSVSGLASLSRNQSQEGYIQNLTIGTFIVRNNSMTTLPIAFDALESLYIQDNANLTTLVYCELFGQYKWKDIVITGNPLLNLTTKGEESYMNETGVPVQVCGPAGCAPILKLEPGWVWPQRNLSTMVFDGPFGNEFFQPLIDMINSTTKLEPKVLQKFIVHSTLSGFDCSQLNDLRKRGAFRGEYSCQNQTVEVQSWEFL
ncbi:hypothetical protein N431DRAFT_557835 [Stipitochalara longipes BDJ]|nr:hypothetical protein N431DRAFT_557835 [Stipitochalara longipes BDJ]